MVCAEMVSANALHYEDERSRRMLATYPDEHPVSMQVFGNDPDRLAGAARVAVQAGADVVLAVYGPFNYGGNYTSPSNARFDQLLAQQHPDSAIRDFEAVDRLASSAGFTLQDDRAMPANNRLLLWRKQ